MRVWFNHTLITIMSNYVKIITTEPIIALQSFGAMSVSIDATLCNSRALELLNINNGMPLTRLLRNVFGVHKALYKEIGFSYNDMHHPEDGDFSIGCGGYATFTRTYPTIEELLVKIADAIANAINRTNNPITISSVIPIHEVEYGIPLADPMKLDKTILFNDSGGYQLSITKVNMPTIQQLQETANKTLQKMYQTRLDNELAQKNKELDQLRQAVTKSTSDAFLDGISVMQSLGSDWIAKPDGLYYKKRIVAEAIFSNGKYYKIPDGRFYISGLKIDIANKIYAQHTHYTKAFHPNANRKGLCIGTLDGAPIEQFLKKVIDTMKVVNSHSMFENRASNVCHEILGNTPEVITERGEAIVWKIQEEE